MSNYLAIATVTSVLGQLISNGMSLPGVDVSAEPVDQAIQKAPQDRLNLFLYQVTPNIGYRNIDQPARGSDGVITKRPQLGLNLHYMITAMATQNDDVRAQMILASAMRTLHENPVLTREMIRQTILAVPSLATSDLADQAELVKIVPQALTLEEITKLWSSFFQTNYRISVAYEATVVLIDSVYDARPTLPVTTRQLTIGTFRQPTILEVQPQVASAGSTLRILGHNLRGDENVVWSVGVGE